MSLSSRIPSRCPRTSLIPLLAVSALLLTPTTGRSDILWSHVPPDTARGLFPASLSLSPRADFFSVREWGDPPASGGQDTSVTPQHRLHLLPPSLSPMETILWGEHGLLRTTGIAPLTPSARMSELRFRRTMLTAHQIGGFVTLGLLVPTLILGQRNIQNWNDAMMGVKPLDRQLNRTHRTLAEITFGTYLATAAMAIFSPPPIIRRNEASTITTHKILAWIHFTGMIATPILAVLAAHAKTADQAKTLRTAHEITAYTTAAALATAMIVITF